MRLLHQIYIALWGFFVFSIFASAEMLSPKAQELRVRDDLRLILKNAGFNDDAIQLERFQPEFDHPNKNLVSIYCERGLVRLQVNASDSEWASTFYLGLQKLGFLFPHPRIQVNPTWDQVILRCGKTFEWKPRLRYRGFHLHTQHPNEWVHGFLMGKQAIADEMIRWLARNGQNVVNIVLLRTVDLAVLEKNLKEPFHLAHSLGILTGINVSFNMQQQKSYRLIDQGFLSSWFGIDDKEARKQIYESILKLAKSIQFDFMNIELGSTEFTSNHYESTLNWINDASKYLQELGRQAFFKIHVSSNQVHPKYGNYNYLPQYASTDVGVWPHSVMFYGLEDDHAPVYGRKDFNDLVEFTLREKNKRPLWYFPETSYYIAMDIDLPIFLTDYLVARSQDMDFLEKNGISGQINFSTGHELGYWLMDWTVALLANSENRGRPMIGLELLGEDSAVWKKIINFQTQYFKNLDLLSLLSSSTLLDEIPRFGHSVIQRVLLKDLATPKYHSTLLKQIEALEEAVNDLPSLEGVQNRELKLLLQVTWNRIRHSLALRYALSERKRFKEKAFYIQEAGKIRVETFDLLKEELQGLNRYPEALIFSQHTNPTSYPYGYGWSAIRLHYWRREEKMIYSDYYSPFFMNIYDPLQILF